MFFEKAYYVDDLEVNLKSSKNYELVACKAIVPFYRNPTDGKIQFFDTKKSFGIKSLKTNVNNNSLYAIIHLSYPGQGNHNSRLVNTAVKETLSFVSPMGYEQLYCDPLFKPWFEGIDNIIFEEVKIPKEKLQECSLIKI